MVCVCVPYDSKDQYSYFPKEHYRIGTFSEDGVSSLSGRNWISVHIWDETQTRKYFSVDKKNQLDVIFVFFIFLLIVAQHVSGVHGRTTFQRVLTTFLQPRHIPTRGYNITQSSAPDGGHMDARNMLSNY